MKQTKVRRIREHYERRVNANRPGYDILDWSSRESQHIRFDVLLGVLRRAFVPPACPRLLDVGCGLADLAGYLEREHFDAAYVGADITHRVLGEARRRRPACALLQADVFADPPFRPRAFDVLYSSGVFNLKLGNNDAFVIRAIEALIPLGRELVVVNMLHRRTRHPYPHCHYFDPEEIVRGVDRPGLELEIIDDYLENDFTLVVHLSGK